MKMEMPEKHIYYIKITEDVSDYDPEFKPRADFGVILEDAIMGEYVRVAEDVSQEVEALKAENEELKAKLDKAKWQPIESAPRDGKSILVTDGYDVCDAYFRGGDWWQYQCGDDWYSTSINPTHWMPLPSCPE